MRPAGIVALLFVCLLVACAEQEPTPAPTAEPSPWSSWKLGTDAEFRDIFFLDGRRGWIVGGSHKITGGIVGSTEDGGLTWNFQSGLARPSPRSHSFHLNAVQFLDERTGIVAADGGIILRTVDGGTHWHRVHGPLRVSAHLHDLHFADARHGWAVGGRILLRTTDGGASWHRPIVSDDESGFSAGGIHFEDWLLGWAASRHGTIFRTDDGGERWIRVFEPGRKRIINSLFFADRNHGWVVGERGMIRHTSDGGYSWRRQSDTSRTWLNDVHFIDPRRGWAVGFSRREGRSVVLQTDDGGATWNEQTSVHGEDLRALFFDEAGRGWSVGDRVRPVAQKLLHYEPEG